MELDRRGAELLFQVLTEREERNSIAIASNESFSGWTKTFTDLRLCAATGSRSKAPSSKPAPTPTASPAPSPNTPAG
jgi:DNA replication protein DnaC